MSKDVKQKYFSMTGIERRAEERIKKQKEVVSEMQPDLPYMAPYSDAEVRAEALGLLLGHEGSRIQFALDTVGYILVRKEPEE